MLQWRIRCRSHQPRQFRILFLRNAPEQQVSIHLVFQILPVIGTPCDLVFQQCVGTAAQAMAAVHAAMAYPMPFSFSTDITKTGRLTASRVNPVQALLSNDENMESFVEAFGGELLFSNPPCHRYPV